tara:strand:+ start:501 stop:689 length:189 start_codon:yes stop_codon:yes gene_type:complete
MIEYFVAKIHNDLDNVDTYLNKYFARMKCNDSNINNCIKDMKYITKRLKKLDRIEKIIKADR